MAVDFRYVGATCKTAGSAAEGLTDVPLTLFGKVEEGSGGNCAKFSLCASELDQICSNLLPPTATMTTTVMMAARAPLESEKAPDELPDAPAVLGSVGLSDPPL